MNVLIVGRGRLGQAIAFAGKSHELNITMVASRTPILDALSETLTELHQFNVVVWCGRDAGNHLNNENTNFNLQDIITILTREKWCGLFVYTSSAGDVYGEHRGWSFSELDLVNPFTSYGVLKARNEKLVSGLAATGKIEFLILRVANIYEIDDNDHGFIGSIVRGYKSDQKVQVLGGHQTRDFIHLKDVAKIYLDLILRQSKGIFNVGTGYSHSINEVVSLFEKKNGPLEIEYHRFVGRVLRSEVSILKLSNLIGWKPEILDSYLDEAHDIRKC